MFKLIVLLFVVTNGVEGNQPVGQFKNKAIFDTEKACLEFLSSDKGESARSSIEELIEREKGRLSAKIVCVQDGALKEDNSI